MSAGSRTALHTPESRAFMIAALIGGIPALKIEAIAVHPGLGEDERVLYAVRRFNAGDFKQLLISGLNMGERTAKAFDIKTLGGEPFSLSRYVGMHTQIHASNTPEQASWVLGKVRELGIRSLAISAPPYHLPRAYLTVLAAFRKAGISASDCMLIPCPTPMSPYYHVPETEVMAAEMVPAEYERILRYMHKGDVANIADLMSHIDSLICVMHARGLI